MKVHNLFQKYLPCEDQSLSLKDAGQVVKEFRETSDKHKDSNEGPWFLTLRIGQKHGV